MSELRKQMKIYMDLKGYSSITTKYLLIMLAILQNTVKNHLVYWVKKKYVSIYTIVSQKCV